MERKIGDIFEYEGKKIQVVEQENCKGCVFDIYFCIKKPSIVGRCYDRKDKKSVIFKEIEK